MKSSKTLWALVVCAFFVAVPAVQGLAPLGTAFTYQGQLKSGGLPVTNTCDFRFTLWKDPVSVIAADQVGPTLTFDGNPLPPNPPPITVVNGLFQVGLDFGTGAINGEARWLEIEVCCSSPCAPVGFVTLMPRQELTPTPHALALPGLWTEQNPTSPNLIGGFSGNMVTLGVVGAAIGGGGLNPNENLVTDNFGTIGGGAANRAGDNMGTTHDTDFATVCGGLRNSASGTSSTIGGGNSNTASASDSTVGGGGSNTASGIRSTVSGGTTNTAGGTQSTIAGGDNNTASGTRSTVGGGSNNMATDQNATVGGGVLNQATMLACTVAGGRENIASGSRSTVAGGFGNHATGSGSSVGGGLINTAGPGLDSTVPGGTFNAAGGEFSFAAGQRAKVRSAAEVGGVDTDGDEGTFVWSDSTTVTPNFFESTGPDQFLINATGGVGIGTNMPTEQLDVTGNIHASGTIASGSSIVIDGTANTISSSADMEMHTASGRVLRFEDSATSPNLIGGFSGNMVTPGVVGATIGGGGETGFENAVTDDYSTVAGGRDNLAGDNAGTTVDARFATVGGGVLNTASATRSTVGGGQSNTASASDSTVGGGNTNTASGSKSTVGGGVLNRGSGVQSTIGGGGGNSASGTRSTVGGGSNNMATDQNATVGGGIGNAASGSGATVPGGAFNAAGGTFSFAAGRRAKVRSAAQVGGGDTDGDEGTFVWGDSTNLDFQSTGPDQFLVRASGGVGIGTTSPLADVHIVGDPLIGTLLIAPNPAGNGSDSQIQFSEDDHFGLGMSITYDGGVNKLFFDGQVFGVSQGPHMSIARNSGQVEILGAPGNSSVILPNDAISAAETLDEPGVASARSAGASVPDTGATVNIISRTITCPAAGFVVAIGTGEVSMLSHDTGTTSTIALGVSDTSATFPPSFNGDVEFTISGNAPSGTYDDVGTVHGTFSVLAGANTFFLVADNFAGDPGGFIHDATLTLMYFPTSYGTVSSPLQSTGNVEDSDAQAAGHAPLTAAQIEAERAEAAAFHAARVEPHQATQPRIVPSDEDVDRGAAKTIDAVTVARKLKALRSQTEQTQARIAMLEQQLAKLIATQGEEK